MTVDMLATAFIWPEEMLIGRTPIRDDLESAAVDDMTPAAETASEPGTTPFWAALVRRFRADPLASGAEAR